MLCRVGICLRLLGLFLGLLVPVSGVAGQPPNIVMIFCDDLTNQAISCFGHPLALLETPNIDRLAREGMLFRRCLVPNSICGPSRAAILTGKYAHVNGFLRNGDRFDVAGAFVWCFAGWRALQPAKANIGAIGLIVFAGVVIGLIEIGVSGIAFSNKHKT